MFAHNKHLWTEVEQRIYNRCKNEVSFYGIPAVHKQEFHKPMEPIRTCSGQLVRQLQLWKQLCPKPARNAKITLLFYQTFIKRIQSNENLNVDI